MVLPSGAYSWFLLRDHFWLFSGGYVWRWYQTLFHCMQDDIFFHASTAEMFFRFHQLLAAHPLCVHYMSHNRRSLNILYTDKILWYNYKTISWWNIRFSMINTLYILLFKNYWYFLRFWLLGSTYQCSGYFWFALKTPFWWGLTWVLGIELRLATRKVKSTCYRFQLPPGLYLSNSTIVFWNY